MSARKSILAIVGSASANSSNHKLVQFISSQLTVDFRVEVIADLKVLPPFDPSFASNNVPQAVLDFRQKIDRADGVLISTPEYIFSIPSCLKNALEWCVATTIFSNKPLGIITASAHGQKGHEELKLIMNTLQARFDEETTLLIQGIKGKVDTAGNITVEKAVAEIRQCLESFRSLIDPTE